MSPNALRSLDFESLRTLAESEDTTAQYVLGFRYYHGEGVPEDRMEGARWFRKAAERGSARAQFNLALCYYRGETLPKNEAEAARWLRKAAEQDDADSQCELGTCYMRGGGVPEDEAEGARWYRKAAEQGHANAQANMGICYRLGRGVPQDSSESEFWFRKAAEQGHRGAQDALHDRSLPESAPPNPLPAHPTPIQPVATKDSPRLVLADHFKSVGELPIRGGWGYTREDACVIDKNDPTVSRTLPFDWSSIEHIFVEKRIFEELIIQRPEGEKFTGIASRMVSQQLLREPDQSFDHLTVEVTAFPEKDWNELRAEYEGPNGRSNPNFDLVAHLAKRDQKQVTLTREFWFDITSKW